MKILKDIFHSERKFLQEVYDAYSNIKNDLNEIKFNSIDDKILFESKINETFYKPFINRTITQLELMTIQASYYHLLTKIYRDC